MIRFPTTPTFHLCHQRNALHVSSKTNPHQPPTPPETPKTRPNLYAKKSRRNRITTASQYHRNIFYLSLFLSSDTTIFSSLDLIPSKSPTGSLFSFFCFLSPLSFSFSFLISGSSKRRPLLHGVFSSQLLRFSLVRTGTRTGQVQDGVEICSSFSCQKKILICVFFLRSSSWVILQILCLCVLW